MRQKIKKVLIRLHFLEIFKTLNGFLHMLRIKLLIPKLMWTNKFLKYTITTIYDGNEIKNLLIEKDIYHPVSDYNFSEINRINKKPYAYII